MGLQKSKAATMRADAPGFVRTVAELAKRRPDDPDLSLLEGDLAYADGRRDDALKHYDAAKRANPQLSEAFFRTGVVYLDQGRLPEAKAMFERALTANALAPLVPRYRNNLAYTLGKLGSYEEAIAEYGKHPKYALSAVESARLLWLAGGADDLARARDHLEQAITWLTDEATGPQPDNRAPWVRGRQRRHRVQGAPREALLRALALSATQFLRDDETSAVKNAAQVRESCKGVLADLQAVLGSDLSLVARTNLSLQGKVNAYRIRILDTLG